MKSSFENTFPFRAVAKAFVAILAISLPSAAHAATTNVYEWTFDGNLKAALGNGVFAFADATTAGVTTFGVSGGAIPTIGGKAAGFMHVPVFNAKENGYNVTLSSTGPNGGGSYINQYSLIMDLLVPAPLNWTALFNTDPDNNNDADWYIAPDATVGIGSLGYGANPVITPGAWIRLGFTADLAAGNVAYYKDGTQFFQVTQSGLLDQRFSLYSTNDNYPSFRFFNEGDTSGNYTHELYIASLAIVDRTLTAAEMTALGGPNAEGIFVRHLNIQRQETNVVLSWTPTPGVRLQSATQLSPANWTNVNGTLGAGSFTALTTEEPKRFFRLSAQ